MYVFIYLFFLKHVLSIIFFLNGLFLYLFIYLLYTQTHGHVCIMWICGTLSLCGIPRRDLSQFSLGYFAMSLDFTAWVRQRSQGLHNASGWTSLTAWHPCFLCRTPRNQDSSTLQDSFRILQHSAVVLELVQATGKATLPRSRRPSFFFHEEPGFAKFKSCKQEHVCVRRFFCGNEGSCWWAGFQTCIWKSWHAWCFFATVLSLSLVNVLLHLLPGYKFVNT